MVSPLERFEAAAPELIARRHLLERVDRKYVLSQRLLDDLLLRLAGDYHVVLSAQSRVATYDSLYFDTPDWRFYNDHRRGVARRHKVRVRHHLERRLSFLEVKARARGTHTAKARLARNFGHDALDDEARSFLGPQIGPLAFTLSPRLRTKFRRVTLVGVDLEERITLDWDLSMRSDTTTVALPGVAVAEIKQRRYWNASPSIEAFRGLNLRELAISKYCFAASRLYPVRTNRFHPAFRALERSIA